MEMSGAYSGTWGSMIVNYIYTTQPGGPIDPTPPEPRPLLLPSLFDIFLPALIRSN
jgi:hypothetical protein